jgi:glycosyltransferase involved in cell wall biosynthesis
MVSRNEVTVVLPVLNEEAAIASVLDELENAGFENVLVVDGNSTDSTVNIALAKGVKVVPQRGSGKGGAVKTGIELAETPYLVVMDGDHTYDPKDIDRLLLYGDKYDLVKGARTSRGNIPLLHRLGNRIISLTFNIMIGKSVTDVCSGMYLLKTAAARSLQLDSRGFDIDAEVAARCQITGSVTEVPITYRKRIGKSKLSTWMEGLRILRRIVASSWACNLVLLASIESLVAVSGAVLLLWDLALHYMYGSAVWSEGKVWLGLFLLVVGLSGLILTLRRLGRR